MGIDSTGTLTRIDPQTFEVGAAIRVGEQRVDVAAGTEDVWVASYEDGTVWRIDRTTLRATSFDIGTPVVAVAIDDEGDGLVEPAFAPPEPRPLRLRPASRRCRTPRLRSSRWARSSTSEPGARRASAIL